MLFVSSSLVLVISALCLAGCNGAANGGVSPPPALPTISGVNAGSITSTGATITWTTNVPTSSQVNYGTTAAYGLKSALSSSLVTSHTVTLTGLSPSTLYHYQAVSVDGSNNQVSSTDYTFTTTATPPLPLISGVSTGSITATGATITWTTNVPTSSQVNYGTTAAYGQKSALSSSLVTSHSVTLTGLSASTLYHYQAVSVDESNNQVSSTDYTFTTAAPPLPVITGVSAGSITATGATITWTTNVPTSSQVNYGTTAAYGQQSALNSSLETSHSVALSGLSPSTLYHYQAVSVDGSNNQVSSTDYTFTTTTASTGVPTLVQATSDSVMNNTVITTWAKRLPNPAIGGNLAVAACWWHGSGANSTTMDVIDDKSGTWTVSPTTGSNANQSTQLEIFYEPNITALMQQIKATLSSPLVLQCQFFEFANVATSFPVDGSSCAASTSGTSVPAGTFTTTTAGDLIFYAMTPDNLATEPTTPVGFTVGDGLTSPLVIDPTSLFYSAYAVQPSAGSITPTGTLSVAQQGAVACAIAFKPASAGGVPSGIHVNTEVVQSFGNASAGGRINWSAKSIAIPFQSVGNLIVVGLEELDTSEPTVTSIPALTWHAASGTGLDSSGCADNTTDATSQCIWYATNSSPGTVTITIAYAATPSVSPVVTLFDVSNAANSPYDVGGGLTGNLAAETGNVNGPSITPTVAGDLIISLIEQNSQAVGSASPGYMLSVLDGGVYQDLGLDQDGGTVVYYDSGASATYTTWTYINTEGPGYQVGPWEAAIAAFKAAE